MVTSYLSANLFAPDSNACDSDILIHSIDKDIFKTWFQQNDSIIVDRGFNGVYVNQTRLNVVSPLFLNGRSQFDEQESNYNRTITAFRWIIEAINRRLREWKSIGGTIPNIRIRIIELMFKVCGALENMFFDEKSKIRAKKKQSNSQIYLDTTNDANN